MQRYKAYIDFIRFSIGNLPSVLENADSIDWADFYSFCLRQSIAGLIFEGIEHSNIKIPQDILFEWIGTVETIRATNHLVDKRCGQISEFWAKQGYRSGILKGQANAMMYPRPELRSPGDIDIWVDGDAKDIIRIAQRKAPDGHYSLHHVTMPVFSDTSIEVHYRPVFLDNWWKDKLLKQYIDYVKEAQFENRKTLNDGKTEVCGLTDDFNVVFLMLHMWHHLLSTRNNFKQLIDYYYLLKKGIPGIQKDLIGWLFCKLGVQKYAQGIMWIEREVLGLDEQYLIVKPDEQIGRLLFHETLNYGEKRVKKSRINTLVRRVIDNLHLFWYFPTPVLIAPVYLLWHQWWKWNMKRQLK